MDEKEQKQSPIEKKDVKPKRHLTPEEDERLREAYTDTLGSILENDDEDARDNLANYMDEIKEESEALGSHPEMNDLSDDKKS